MKKRIYRFRDLQPGSCVISHNKYMMFVVTIRDYGDHSDIMFFFRNKLIGNTYTKNTSLDAYSFVAASVKAALREYFAPLRFVSRFFGRSHRAPSGSRPSTNVYSEPSSPMKLL